MLLVKKQPTEDSIHLHYLEFIILISFYSECFKLCIQHENETGKQLSSEIKTQLFSYEVYNNILENCANNVKSIFSNVKLNEGRVEYTTNQINYINSIKRLLTTKTESLKDWNFVSAKIRKELKPEKANLIKPSEYVTISSDSKIRTIFKAYILLLFQTIQDLEEGFNSFCKTLGRYVKEVNVIKGKTVHDGIPPFLINTDWFLYYHEYEIETPFTVISRIVLSIRKLSTIIYERIPDNDFILIKSSFIPEKDTTSVIMNFERKVKGDYRPLELRVSITNPKNSELDPAKENYDNSIFLGQFIDLDRGNTIISGSCIFQNVIGFLEQNNPINFDKGSAKEFTKERSPFELKNCPPPIQIALVYYTNWKDYIPSPIAKFLSEKAINITKTKGSVIEDINSFEIFYKNQRIKNMRNRKYNSEIEYDIFLVTSIDIPSRNNKNQHSDGEANLYSLINTTFFENPNPSLVQDEYTSNSKKNYREVNEINLFKASTELLSIGIQKVYFEARQFKVMYPNQPGYQESRTLLQRAYKVLRLSSAVVVILTEDSLSSPLIRLGMTIQVEKTVVIFRLSDFELPPIISTGYDPYLVVYPYPVNVDEIPSIIKQNAKLWFSRFLNIP